MINPIRHFLFDSEEADAAGTTESSQPEEEVASLITEGYCGEKLTWEYIEGALYIKGTGEMYDYDQKILPEWIYYADQIMELHIDKGIIQIDGDAFEDLKELKAIYFEGNEKEWKELTYENDRTEEEEIGTVGENGMKDVFAEVAEYYFGEEIPVDGEDAEDISGTEEKLEETKENAGESSPRRAGAKAAAEGLQIVTEPEDISAAIGDSVSLHVEVNKADVAYQWQWSADGKTWKNCKSSGYNTDTMHFVMSEANDGRQYRCIVTGGSQSVTTRAVQLTFADPEIEGVIYKLIDDVMTVTGYRGTADVVVVRETVEGHTVTVIGESAFEGSTIRSIDLPDTIQLIKKRAIANCSNLTNMN